MKSLKLVVIIVVSFCFGMMSYDYGLYLLAPFVGKRVAEENHFAKKFRSAGSEMNISCRTIDHKNVVGADMVISAMAKLNGNYFSYNTFVEYVTDPVTKMKVAQSSEVAVAQPIGDVVEMTPETSITLILIGEAVRNYCLNPSKFDKETPIM